MLVKGVVADHAPERVKVELLPDGRRRVALRDNIRTEELAGEEGTSTAWKYNEVIFVTRSQLDVGDVEAKFESWWDYGEKQSSDDVPVAFAAVMAEILKKQAEQETALGHVFEALCEVAELADGGAE